MISASKENYDLLQKLKTAPGENKDSSLFVLVLWMCFVRTQILNTVPAECSACCLTWVRREGQPEEQIRLMVDLPGDVSERAVTVEEVMQKNLGHGTWPTAEVVILQMSQFPGLSMNWSQLLISPVVREAGVHGNVFFCREILFLCLRVWMYLEMFIR